MKDSRTSLWKQKCVSVSLFPKWITSHSSSDLPHSISAALPFQVEIKIRDAWKMKNNCCWNIEFHMRECWRIWEHREWQSQCLSEYRKGRLLRLSETDPLLHLLLLHLFYFFVVLLSQTQQHFAICPLYFIPQTLLLFVAVIFTFFTCVSILLAFDWVSKRNCSLAPVIQSVVRQFSLMQSKVQVVAGPRMSTSVENSTRSEIRSVLLRHWISLDRARLHTIHFWLFLYAIAQLFIEYYFSEVYTVSLCRIR